jgi:phosphoribosylamine--glycine ligase
MRVLVIGGGGREHALVWKIVASPRVEKIYCAPGNAGIARLAECVAITASDVDALAAFAVRERIDLTVAGPEAPLVAGIVDRFEALGLAIFGPSAGAAQLEGSKVFAKELMREAEIPTAPFVVCSSPEEAREQLRLHFDAHGADSRIVVKAEGLAAGKGVIVAEGEREASEAVRQIMAERIFGAAGDRIVLEKCLTGQEASIMAITDGRSVVPLLPSQDHKRVFDGDRGPNTGGMGAYAPVPVVPPAMVTEVTERIMLPAIRTLAARGLVYRGLLYAGIMLTEEGPQTIEFNCRFGDPETQTILPLLESDLVELMLRSLDGSLASAAPVWADRAAVCVVAASGGYPGAYERGCEISGLEEAEGPGRIVFHAGTRAAEGRTLTDGGRVLSVTGTGPTLRAAADSAYSGLSAIRFEGIHFRRDIGARGFGPE